MRGDVFDLFVELGMKIVTGRVAHEPRTRAITAIRRATVRYQKQHAVGVAMHESRHWRVRIFPARVAHFPGRRMRLLNARDDLPADRTVFVRGIDEAKKIRRDGERQYVVCEFRAGEFFWCL